VRGRGRIEPRWGGFSKLGKVTAQLGGGLQQAGNGARQSVAGVRRGGRGVHAVQEGGGRGWKMQLPWGGVVGQCCDNQG